MGIKLGLEGTRTLKVMKATYFKVGPFEGCTIEHTLHPEELMLT